MNRVLDIDLLRTFRAVAQLGKFKAAAASLNKTQSAVSMQIRRLEDFAGVPLLERNNRHVALTHAGELLLTEASELLAVHDRVAATLAGASVGGHVRLGMPEDMAARALSHVLPFFAETHPQVSLDLEMTLSGHLVEKVENGELDLAIATVTEAEAARRNATVLWRTTPVWAGPRQRDLHERDPLPLALHPAACLYRSAVLNALEAAGRRWRIAVDTTSVNALQVAIAAGLGVGILDRRYVTGAMSILGEQEGLPPFPPHVVVLVMTSASPPPPVQALADAIIRHLSE